MLSLVVECIAHYCFLITLQNGLTALHKAAKWGHTAVVKLLLASRKFNVNMQDKVSANVAILPHTRQDMNIQYTRLSYNLIVVNNSFTICCLLFLYIVWMESTALGCMEWPHIHCTCTASPEWMHGEHN